MEKEAPWVIDYYQCRLHHHCIDNAICTCRRYQQKEIWERSDYTGEYYKTYPYLGQYEIYAKDKE